MKLLPMKNIHSAFFILIGICFTFFSCNEEFKTTETYKDEMYCEAWGADSLRPDSSVLPEEEAEQNVNSFLQSNRVHVADITFTNTPDSITQADSLLNCPSCRCFTGRRIEVEVYAEDSSQMKIYGFDVY